MISIEQITYLNEIGQRPKLEDSIYPAPGRAVLSDKLFLVCDGVGGESMGEEASRIACEEFASFFEEEPPFKGSITSEYLNKAQKQVLAEMGEYAKLHPDAQKMSTTLTLVYLSVDSVSVAWCGDSRVYHLREGKTIWRSADHSLVENLVKHGEITEEEARLHPQRNIITRSLSASGAPSDIDRCILDDVREGDYIMLCTDGVLEQINEDRLTKILLAPGNDKKQLFLNYCEGLTKDNFSLYLLKLHSDKVVAANPVGKKATIPILISIAVILLFAVLFKDRIIKPVNPKKNDSIGRGDKPVTPGKPEIQHSAKKQDGTEPSPLPSSQPASSGHDHQDGIGHKPDTGKGVKVTVPGAEMKIKSAIEKVKKPNEEKPGSAGKDSVPAENAPAKSSDQ